MIDLYFKKTHKEFFDFVSDAQDEIIIISPYIKLGAIKLLLEKVRPGVKVVVVGRWKMSDLVFGSSDIEVYGYLKELKHSFYINNKIHLKIIVKDKSEILIGSANITGSGLGLFEGSNIEAIAIDSLDQRYLPEVYSILRESILVDDDLARKLSEKLELYLDVKDKREQIKADLEKIEQEIFVKSMENILVYDFPFSQATQTLIQSLENGDISDAVKHDLILFGLNANEVNMDLLRNAFLKSDAYTWQLENIKEEALFGRYSELLHNALVDNPKPYRKQVKELVANMFNWTKELSQDYEIKEYEHTKALVRIK